MCTHLKGSMYKSRKEAMGEVKLAGPVCVCVRVCVHIYECTYEYIYTEIQIYRIQRPEAQSWYHSSGTVHLEFFVCFVLYFEIGALFGLELTEWARPADQ